MTDYVKRAEKAIRTGQPRLAELYMRRALIESEPGRRWLARYDFVLWCRATFGPVSLWSARP